MKISVVLATYNGERFVEEQLRTIASQTRRPDELVVVDDQSSDGTVRTVERVCAQAELPLTMHRHDARSGVVATFDHGIGAASGDVIALCDQDDRWLPDKLATLQRAFEESPSLRGLFSDGWIVDEAGERSNRTLWDAFGFTANERAATDELALLRALLRRNVVTGTTLAFAASTRDLLLPLDPRGLHDVWIAVLLAAQGGLRALPEKLVEYRLHGANVVGLGERKAGRAMRARQTGGQLDELAHYEAMMQRLRERAPDESNAMAMLEEKVAHLRMRCALPRSPLRRAARIVGSLPSYTRYSSGWRSPVLDLVAPTQERA